MSLSKEFKRAVVIGLLASTTLAGCGQQIGGSDAAPDLQGTVASETLARSGTPVTRVYLDGARLQAGKSYKFNDVSLTIRGNVPAKTSITGKGGQIIVTGDIGDKASIEVTVPEYQRHVPDTCTSFMYINNMMIPYAYDCSYNVDTGPKPPYDRDPVIVTQGKVGNGVSFSSSYRTQRDGRP